MTVKIYTWKSGETNILCDACADHMFFTLIDRVVKNNPELSEDQLRNLDSIKQLNHIDQTAQEINSHCQPIETDIDGNTICYSF